MRTRLSRAGSACPVLSQDVISPLQESDESDLFETVLWKVETQCTELLDEMYGEEKRPPSSWNTDQTQGVIHGVIKPTKFIPMEKRSKDFGILEGFYKPSSSFIDFCCHLEQSNGEKCVHCRWRFSPCTVTHSVPKNAPIRLHMI